MNFAVAGLLGFVFTWAAPLLPRAAAQWPDVKRLDESFRITDRARPVVKAVVRSANGDPLYLFVCRTGDDETVAGVIYVGDLDCRLMDARRGEIETNLLVETSANVAAWYSRGRMFARELYGDCARYPEYGLLRHFRLRGMHLTMTFTRVRFSRVAADQSPMLVSYTLRLRVEPDRTAERDIAESSGYLDPSTQVPGSARSCSIVQKGNEWGEK
jgi:hypothetical protein